MDEDEIFMFDEIKTKTKKRSSDDKEKDELFKHKENKTKIKIKKRSTDDEEEAQLFGFDETKKRSNDEKRKIETKNDKLDLKEDWDPYSDIEDKTFMMYGPFFFERSRKNLNKFKNAPTIQTHPKFDPESSIHIVEAKCNEKNDKIIRRYYLASTPDPIQIAIWILKQNHRYFHIKLLHQKFDIKLMLDINIPTKEVPEGFNTDRDHIIQWTIDWINITFSHIIDYWKDIKSKHIYVFDSSRESKISLRICFTDKFCFDNSNDLFRAMEFQNKVLKDAILEAKHIYHEIAKKGGWIVKRLNGSDIIHRIISTNNYTHKTNDFSKSFRLPLNKTPDGYEFVPYNKNAKEMTDIDKIAKGFPNHVIPYKNFQMLHVDYEKIYKEMIEKKNL